MYKTEEEVDYSDENKDISSFVDKFISGEE